MNFENLAQYLADSEAARLAPTTVRKMLQFADLREFERYLEARVARDLARKIADAAGADKIDISAVRVDLLNLVGSGNGTGMPADQPVFYHRGCEYDPLRGDETHTGELADAATGQYEVGGHVIKSTFIGFTATGEVEKVDANELPDALLHTTPAPIAHHQQQQQHQQYYPPTPQRQHLQQQQQQLK